MSLQVWLPLNGNVNNQGLLSNPTISKTPTYVDGKLGKAMSTGALTLTAEQTNSVLNNKAVSFCFWIKVIGTDRQMIFGNEGMSANNNRKFAIFQYPTVNDLHLSWMNDTGNNTFIATILTGCFPNNIWTHCAITYENPICKVYINGEVKAEYNGVSNSSTFAYSTPLIYNSSGRLLNDFRIYDHCLSAKEVKEISKGLVLHYQLKGFGQPNLINKAELYTNSTKLTRTASKSDDYIHTSMTVNLTANTTYTISFYTTGAMPNQVELGLMFQNGYNYYKFMNGSYHYKIMDGLYYHNEPFTVANTGSYTIRCDWNISGETHSFWNFKIEEGSKATPWCPNSADSLYSFLGFNSNIEPDCSGFNNNGTKSGSIISDSNSPRYNSCYKIGSAFTKIKLPALSYSAFGNSYTFSWWEYNTTTNNMPWGFSDGNRLNLYHTGNLCWNTGDGGNNPFKNSSGTAIPNTKLCDSKWHHCAIVGNGTTTILYIDGIEAGKATTYKALTGTQIYISGWDTGIQYTFNGSKLSDFRIYATALSAADVLELYNSSISIDKLGNMYAYEYQEV